MKSYDITDFGSRSTAHSPASVRSWRRQIAALTLAAGLHLMQLHRAHGENYAGYRYESYREDDGRVRIETQAFSFEQRLRPWVDLKGEVVYDCISGATPTGAPPPSTLPYLKYPELTPATGLSTTVPIVPMHDIRWAGGIEPTFNLGRHRITPGVSYSEEHDYVSYGASLNYSVDLNEKNTTLNVGWSHNWDKVYQDSRRHTIMGHKDTDDVILGINQLLGPKTVFTGNLTYGNARGYLSDPYKAVVFTGNPYNFLYFPGATELIPPGEYENRPRHRDRFIVYLSLTQAVTPLDASVEGSYRFFHDTYGINAHTVALEWHQKIGKHLTISPLFRYYRQNAADFYYTSLPGSPGDPTTPKYYSADYRLSELESFAYGVSLNIKPVDWLSIEASYKRYVMQGLDDITSPSAYPSAHVVTVGFRLWF